MPAAGTSWEKVNALVNFSAGGHTRDVTRSVGQWGPRVECEGRGLGANWSMGEGRFTSTGAVHEAEPALNARC